MVVDRAPSNTAQGASAAGGGAQDDDVVDGAREPVGTGAPVVSADAAATPATATPAAAPGTAASVESAVPAAAEPARPVDPAVPVEEQVLDPRAIARASLLASRNASLWWTSAGVLAACATSLLVGTRSASYVLAAVLVSCAVVRGLLPSPGPVAVSVRAKAIDVTVLLCFALGIGALAWLLPAGTL